jgi:hypothetical protein
MIIYLRLRLPVMQSISFVMNVSLGMDGIGKNYIFPFASMSINLHIGPAPAIVEALLR